MQETAMEEWLDFLEKSEKTASSGSGKRASFYRQWPGRDQLSEQHIDAAVAQNDVTPIQAAEIRVARGSASRRDLVHSLETGTSEEKRQAHRVLKSFPWPVPEAIPALVARLAALVENEVPERYWTLDSLLAQHPRLEIAAARPAAFSDAIFKPEDFEPVAGPLLFLLEHGDLQTRHRAAELLAIVRPAGTIDALIEGLRSRLEGSTLYGAELWALPLGRFDADEAVPSLEHALRLGLENASDKLVKNAAYALSEIGEVSTAGLEALRQAQGEKRFNSTIRMRLRSCTERLERLAGADPPRWRRRVDDPALLTLIDELTDERPWPNYGRSDPPTKTKRTLALGGTPIDIESLAALFDAKPPAPVFEAACHLLGVAITAEDSEPGRELLRRWLAQAKLSSRQEESLLVCALKAKEPAGVPIARKRLEKSRGRDSTARSYLVAVGGDGAADAVLPLLDERKHRELAIVWLGEIGSTRAIPALLHYASRPFESGKNDERWWRTFAIEALGRIASPEAKPGLFELFTVFDEEHVAAHRRRILGSLYACDPEGHDWRRLLGLWRDGFEDLENGNPKPLNPHFLLDFLNYCRRIGIDGASEIVDAWGTLAPRIAEQGALAPRQVQRVRRHFPHLEMSAFGA